MPAPNGLIVAWPSASAIPGGWSRYASLDDRFPLGSSSALLSTAGSTSHTHTDNHFHEDTHSHDPATSGGESATTNNVRSGNTSVPKQGHTHTLTVNPASGVYVGSSSSISSSASNIDGLNRYTVRWIQSDGTTDIPVGAVAWTKESTIPSGWAACDGTAGTPDLRTKFLYGASAGNNGGTSNSSSTHSHTFSSHNHNHTATHTHTGGTVGAANTTTRDDFPPYGTVAPANHVHGVSGSTSSTSHGGSTGAHAGDTSQSFAPQPPYMEQNIIQCTSAGNTPAGIIAIWTNSTPPSGWKACDGNSGRPNLNGQYIPRGTSTNAGVTGGTGGISSHAHTGGAHTHTADTTVGTHTLGSVTLTAASGSQDVDTGAGANIGTTTHTHSFAGSTGNQSGSVASGLYNYQSADHMPPCLRVFFIISLGPSRPRAIMVVRNELSRLISKVGI